MPPLLPRYSIYDQPDLEVSSIIDNKYQTFNPFKAVLLSPVFFSPRFVIMYPLSTKAQPQYSELIALNTHKITERNQGEILGEMRRKVLVESVAFKASIFHAL